MKILKNLNFVILSNLIKNCFIKKETINYFEDYSNPATGSLNVKLNFDKHFAKIIRLEQFMLKLRPFYTFVKIENIEKDINTCVIKIEYLSEKNLIFNFKNDNPNAFKDILQELEKLFFLENEKFFISVKDTQFSSECFFKLITNNKFLLDFYFIIGVLLKDLYYTLCIFKKNTVNLINKIQVCSNLIRQGKVSSLVEFYKICFEIFENNLPYTVVTNKDNYKQAYRNNLRFFTNKLSHAFSKNYLHVLFNNYGSIPESDKVMISINFIFNKSKMALYKKIRYYSYKMKLTHLLKTISKCKDPLIQDICIYNLSSIWNKDRSNVSSISIAKNMLLLILNDIENFKYKFDHQLRIFNLIFSYFTKNDFYVNFYDALSDNDIRAKIFIDVYNDFLEGQNFISKIKLYFLCCSKNEQELYCLIKLETQPKLLFIIYNLCAFVIKIKKKLIFNYIK